MRRTNDERSQNSSCEVPGQGRKGTSGVPERGRQGRRLPRSRGPGPGRRAGRPGGEDTGWNKRDENQGRGGGHEQAGAGVPQVFPGGGSTGPRRQAEEEGWRVRPQMPEGGPGPTRRRPAEVTDHAEDPGAATTDTTPGLPRVPSLHLPALVAARGARQEARSQRLRGSRPSALQSERGNALEPAAYVVAPQVSE